MKEFFGFGGYERPVEGYLSWQHLLFVSILVSIMFFLSIFLGIKNKNKEEKQKNKILVIAAILINVVEIFKIIILCIRGNDYLHWLYELPLFLCSIQLITIPLAAFSKGKIKEAALDFIVIFGLIGAILGTYAAGNNYASYPVLSIDNVASGITHCISGFSSVYILVSKMSSMKKENIIITFAILTTFCILAYIANISIGGNYMFLMQGDGTPYDILYNLVDGNKVLYPILVVVLFYIYILIFYGVFYLIKKGKKV